MLNDPLLATKKQYLPKLAKAVFQSGTILNFHDQNLLQRIKINKREFKIKPSLSASPIEHVLEVVLPFAPMIQAKSLRIFVSFDIQIDNRNM